MEDFGGGMLVVLIISLISFTSCSYGSSSANKDTVSQCGDFNKFSYDYKVYSCDLIKNNQIIQK